MKQRVEYVDLAKGFCILIIVLTHTFGESGGQMMEFFSNFKIPVFFVLSGFFYRKYDSPYFFFIKKTNQLIIPVFFSFLFFSLIWTFLFNIKSEESLYIRNIFLLPDTFKINFGLSPSTWFLVCLFHIFIFSYLLFWICKNKYFIFIISFVIGGVGYYLNLSDISLPIWIDTAFTNLPFFVVGYYIWNDYNIMRESNSPKHYYLFAITFAVMVMLFFTMDANDNIFYAANRFTNVGFWRLYLAGFGGSLFIILLSKFIGHLFIVSYIGRYSIVVLITHQFYLFVIRNILYQINVPQESELVSISVFIIVVLVSLPTIKYGVKYLPYCFAQKDLLH